MPPRHLAWLVLVPLAVLATAVWSFTAPPPEKDYQRLHALVDVLAEVDKSYYRELSDAEKTAVVEAMIQGGLKKLDPYSEYFNEKQFKEFSAENKGTFGGIGAYLGIDPKTNTLMVDTPMADGPAVDAGLLSGDLILKIDGVPTQNADYETCRGKILGEPGTALTLTIGRGEKTFDVALTRAIIQVQAVKGVRRRADDPKRWDFVLDPAEGIALVRLGEFSEKAFKEVEAALADADAAGVKALVLDMRNNGGGLLNMAEKIADLFLADGVIVRTRDRFNLGKDTKAKKDGTPWESSAQRPMAVLVNRGSASATEIVAAALQDNGRAVVVGERTFGKGSVQRSIVAADEKTALKLTTQIWLTPKGKHIDRGVTLTPDEAKDEKRDRADYGVAPDPGFEVKLTEAELIQYFLHLRQMDRGGAKAPEPAKAGDPAAPKLDPNYKDAVLEKALVELRAKLKGQAKARLMTPSRPA